MHVVGAVHRPGPGAPAGRLPGRRRGRAAGGATASARPRASTSPGCSSTASSSSSSAAADRAAAAAPGPRRGRSPGAGAGPAGPVDLNTATLEALDALPGIGPVLAQRILDWRTAHGRFSSVDELGEVSGIGEATLADLRPVVTV